MSPSGRGIVLFGLLGVIAGEPGTSCVCASPHYRGWGFGHSAFVNDRQHHSWAGKPIEKTVFEIAVKSEPLTEAEIKKLLKKGNVRE